MVTFSLQRNAVVNFHLPGSRSLNTFSGSAGASAAF
jgi:hypothetical protein